MFWFIAVVCLLHNINTLKQNFMVPRFTMTLLLMRRLSLIVNKHSNGLPYKFAVNVKERQDKLPTMYWLPKLHKRPYKARFIANSSSV